MKKNHIPKSGILEIRGEQVTTARNLKLVVNWKNTFLSNNKKYMFQCVTMQYYDKSFIARLKYTDKCPYLRNRLQREYSR